MSYHRDTEKTFFVEGQEYTYYSLQKASKLLGDVSRLPYSLKILLENLLRFQDGKTVTHQHIESVVAWLKTRTSQETITFMPARVLMQDFTGVPCLADLAAMRTSFAQRGVSPKRVNPLIPVDLVVDHSVTVDKFATPQAYHFNVEEEIKRNHERYAFLRWGQEAFRNLRIVPPGMGICHQVNLEYLAKVVWSDVRDGRLFAYPDTVVGLDSHTPMVNGLGVLAWGVGGIEAEAAMLGQPFYMMIPNVVGVHLTGRLREGVLATDLVLTLTQLLRENGVVGKFVEFYGEGVAHLSVEERATLSNMAPEYGATCGLFPIDEVTLDYMKFTGRSAHQLKLVEAYAKEQGLWHGVAADFTETITFALEDVEASIAGPRRPQDRILLKNVPAVSKTFFTPEEIQHPRVSVEDQDYTLGNGDIAIAAITSCTNTSNPRVMMAAGLLARNAVRKGLTCKPWIKTSLAPGSQVVSEYYEKSGLQKDLDALGFYVVGYGCTTCIGNSGPLPDPVSQAIEENNLSVAAVLSGNRNFEGRIHSQVKMSFLASPPLVIAYALAGSIHVNLAVDSLGKDLEGKDVYLRDIWPSFEEIEDVIKASVTPQMFEKTYAHVFKGSEEWAEVPKSHGEIYHWSDDSTYVRCPPFFTSMVGGGERKIEDARPLVILGDSVTTDHISPAGVIHKESPAGFYLLTQGVAEKDFNSYGARRGNHEVMMRGTFANIRLQNEITPGFSGGVTRYIPDGEIMPIYQAAMLYKETETPLIVIAGQEYGTGSSRDWAAKGPRLLGVEAVIAESFERIHRSNLIGMGILPLRFTEGMTRHSLNLEGTELFDVEVGHELRPQMKINVQIKREDGRVETIPVHCCIETYSEVEYYKAGSILHYVSQHLRQKASSKQ